MLLPWSARIKTDGVNVTYAGLIPQIQKPLLSKDVDAMQPHIRAFVERAATFTSACWAGVGQWVHRNTAWIIDLGPGAGHDGGRIVFEGTPCALTEARTTLTGQHLATCLDPFGT